VSDTTGSLLYVDDDREARLVLPRFLERVAPLRTATTLAAARAAIAEETPAVLVIDPALPDGDGTDLVDEVRAAHPWVRVLVIPQAAWAEHMSRFIAAGANDVAVKPFDVGRLPARARALLRAAEGARSEVAYRQVLESRLSHVERITTLGTLCATVAHEIASPLTLVTANVDLLAEALRSGEPLEPARAELSQAITEIRLAARLIQTFVQRIRMFSRRDERKRVRGSLGSVIDTALLLIKPRLSGRGIAVQRPEGPSPEVAHYPIRLTQALMNLLANAIDSVGAQGKIRVSYIDEPDAAGLAVEDDGPGMSEEVRRHVFEPFFTSKAEGTGLGLVLVRAIVREHDGRFELLPSPSGHGVLARLLLPRNVEDRPTTP
jgi:signal transduction histidine kinase